MRDEHQGRIQGSLRSTILIVGLIMVLVASAELTMGLLTSSIEVVVGKRGGRSGVKGSVDIGVYTTHQCTTNLTRIDWGMVRPGSNYTRVGYIYNNGDAPVTLSMQTINWNPATAAKTMSVIWNYDGRVVRPNQVIGVTWTLIVSADASDIQDFSFDVVVSKGT